jgi:hypothetical protein
VSQRTFLRAKHSWHFVLKKRILLRTSCSRSALTYPDARSLSDSLSPPPFPRLPSPFTRTRTHTHTHAQAREEYFKKIELTLQALKDRAVALPADLTAAITAAIANARSNIEDAHLFDRVKAAYDAVLKYPAVVAVIEKTAPVAAKAVDMATPYVTTAKDMATPYVTKAVEVATPYATKAVDMVGL